MKTVIITSGGSQLITQIATLKHLGVFQKKMVVFYIGVEYASLIETINLISNYYGLNYIGSIPNLTFPDQMEAKDFRKPKKIAKKMLWSTEIKKQIESNNNKIKAFKNCQLVMTFRHKIASDVFLLKYLNPSKLILTADGVIDKPFDRNFKSLKFLNVNTPLNNVPIKQKIYTPNYLASDTKKVGKVEKISDEIIKTCFESLLQVEEFKKLKREIEEINPKSIVFSQHLSLNGNCSFETEVQYYMDIMKDLIKSGNHPIVFKLHPRDLPQKAKLLNYKMKELDGKAVLLSNSLSSIPIEVMHNYIYKNSILLVTASSSAPLFIKKEKSNLISYKASYLPDMFNNEIADFSSKNNGILKSL